LRGKKQAQKEQSSKRPGKESLSFVPVKESAATVVQNSPSVRSEHDQEGQSGDEGASVPPPAGSVSPRSQPQKHSEADLVACSQIIEALIAEQVL
jgi:hypothetical protein